LLVATVTQISLIWLLAQGILSLFANCSARMTHQYSNKKKILAALNFVLWSLLYTMSCFSVS